MVKREGKERKVESSIHLLTKLAFAPKKIILDLKNCFLTENDIKFDSQRK